MRFISYKENRGIITDIKKLYMTAFPSEERAPLSFLKYMALKENKELYAIYDNDYFVGLLYTISHDDIIFVFYIAINSEKRGSGYGSHILRELIKRSPNKRIILNIEEVTTLASNYEEREKRKKFYIKNGFRDANIYTVERGVVHEMLVYGSDVSKQEYIFLMNSFMGKLLTKLIVKLK